MERRIREKDRLEELGRQLAVDPDTAVGIVLKPGFFFEDDQGPGEALGQLVRGPDHLVDHSRENLQVVVREWPANKAHPAKLVECSTKLRLKEHDDADQDRGRGIAKDR